VLVSQFGWFSVLDPADFLADVHQAGLTDRMLNIR
jgi:hypothetical protein